MRRHVYYYTMLEAPYRAVADLLGADPARWLPLPAEAIAVAGPGAGAVAVVPSGPGSIAALGAPSGPGPGAGNGAAVGGGNGAVADAGPGMSVGAGAGGWRVRLHADGALPTPVAGHDASVQVGEADEHDGAELVRSLAWQSLSSDRLMPVLEADLELASLEGHGCQLSMMGSYRPPLSVVGEAGDRLFGRRVAEACVRRFVLDVAERLEAAPLRV